MKRETFHWYVYVSLISWKSIPLNQYGHCQFLKVTGNHLSIHKSMFIQMLSCRALDQQYPHLVTENDYMKDLIMAREAQNLNDSHLFPLHLFSLENERLQLGGALLPDLVEFYLWIHTHLSHLVTYEKAQQITIGKVISLSAKRYSQKLCEHLTDLFKRIIGTYYLFCYYLLLTIISTSVGKKFEIFSISRNCNKNPETNS